MNEVSNFIATVGFPMAIACGLLYIIYVTFKTLIAKIIVAFDTITHTNEELVKTNSVFANKMDNIEHKVDNVLNILERKEV